MSKVFQILHNHTKIAQLLRAKPSPSFLPAVKGSVVVSESSLPVIKQTGW
jgi:hypothetical protein